MGFFSSLFGQAKELTKLGNSVANVKNRECKINR